MQNDFWSLTMNAHLYRAIIEWSMVFGTDKNEVHWKQVVPAASQDRCRNRFLEAASFTHEDWSSYWNTMTAFRNEYAAHRKPARQYPIVPFMEKSLLVAFAYDDWFREEDQAVFPHPRLRDQHVLLTQSVPRLVKALLKTTRCLDKEPDAKAN